MLNELGDPSGWPRPDGYPNSLALCVIDSIWSIGIRYSTVVQVLDRYLTARGENGLEACQSHQEGPRAFLAWFSGPSGPHTPERLSELVANRNRTSSKNGVLKATAVVQAMQLLSGEAIESTEDLRTRGDSVKDKWTSTVPGQRSGISWSYLLMLAGEPGVKADRMVMSFMKRMSAPSQMTADQFVDLVVQEINDPRIDATNVDHQIWLTERSRYI